MPKNVFSHLKCQKIISPKMAMTKISASYPYGMYAPAYMYSEQENGQFRLDTFPPDTFPPGQFHLEYFSSFE